MCHRTSGAPIQYHHIQLQQGRDSMTHYAYSSHQRFLHYYPSRILDRHR